MMAIARDVLVFGGGFSFGVLLSLYVFGMALRFGFVTLTRDIK
jgi:hypothetical protein